MINADEHKKLLAQVIGLERNSINYFDVEKEFFLIDSDNLSQVRPKLYGYSIQRTGIYEDDNLTPETIAGLNGRGCYVYVEVKDGQITIKQDLNGSWGIYLFRHGDYFAISNSFFRLLDHVKLKYPLTVNRDYCNHFLFNDLCSHSYLETAVNEIQLVKRNAIIHIDTTKKTLEIELIDYKDHSLALDSEEGIAILDKWIEFWGNVLRNVAQRTPFIQADLSGGFDSRMSLLLLLRSGIDLNKIQFHSANTSYQPFKEDYEIASKIAEHYGFKLNRQLPKRRALNYSLVDVWNMSSYVQQPFHKMSYLSRTSKAVDKLYCITGHGGEIIRGYWHSSPIKFLGDMIQNINRYYPRNLSEELSCSMENIIKSSFRAVSEAYKIEDQTSESIPQYLYQEARSRNHFGKEFVLNYFKNSIIIAPILDPELHAVKLDTPQCPDPKLLTALIYVRNEPDLLTFPFQGQRSIAPETIEYAKRINEQFPRPIITDKVDWGGGIIIYCRVICMLNKLSLLARTILYLLRIFRKSA